ncbi:MAG: ABC transporter ATP-binding protein [Flexilinea sp.]
MLSIKNVSIRYGSNPVIDDVSLDIHSGKIIALLGPNGSGKTTLIRGITGTIPLTNGRIEFLKRDLSTLNETERAKLISVVPQTSQLPAGFKVFETVALGRTPYIDWMGRLSKSDIRIIENAIRETSIEALRETAIQALSGGEQQRVILARALAQDAPVMILDEPTSHLDLTYQVGLLSIVRRLCLEKEIAVLIVLHDLNLAVRFADEVAILDHGKIKSYGTPEEVMTEETLSSVFRLPMRIIQPENGGRPVIIPK